MKRPVHGRWPAVRAKPPVARVLQLAWELVQPQELARQREMFAADRERGRNLLSKGMAA